VDPYKNVPIPPASHVDFKSLPEALASTLDRILNELAVLTQTVSLLDERMSTVEENMEFFIERERQSKNSIPEYNNNQSDLDDEFHKYAPQ
jgi:hypothetical protein